MAESVFAGYPSGYSAGMSNLGFHFLFAGLRSNCFIRAERFFADTVPFTLESGSRISSARLLFFSVSYEEDYLNIARMLEGSGIPSSRRERDADPIVIAGGAAPGSNPYPLSEIADVIAIGEGEGTLQSMLDILEKEGAGDRETLLAEFAGLEGILVPGTETGTLKFPEPTPADQFPSSFAISKGTAFPGMMLIETGRGCPGRCGFCLSGSVYSPVRMVSFHRFRKLLEGTDGFPDQINRVGLVSTAVAANPDFVPMTEYLLNAGVGPGFSSFRAGDITEGKARLIGKAGTRSVTLAPESGSEQARRLLGKCTDDDTYLRAASLLAENGVSRFGLYLLTGYPGENEQVVKETGSFLDRFRRAVAGASLEIHINVVVPKPWTPMQFYPLPPESELEKGAGRLARVCRKFGRTKVKSVKSSIRQGVMSIGDERVGRAAIACGKGEMTWKKALKEHGVDPLFIHSERKGGKWHRISGPVTEEELMRRYREIRTDR